MSDIDEIRSRANIVEYIGTYVKLGKAGKNFKGLCPFHGEKTPSFMVSPERGSFHCFGCGKGGSIFDFVMLYHNVDFREALELLAEYTGVELTRFSPITNEDKLKEQLLDIHIKAVEYYEYLYTTHPLGKKAQEYLASRGVSEKVRKTFGIGYSANSWDGLKSYLQKKGFSEDSIIKSGLTIASSRGSYDRFRGRLMFPQRDFRGRVVGFSGRLLEQNVKEAKYINTSETILYSKSNILYGLDVTKEAIKKADSVILVEGEFDVISLFQNGVSNVVAIKGSALTEGHIRLIKRFTQTIYFCLDSDIAGDTASRRGILLADAAGCA
jgi:DNA primase